MFLSSLERLGSTGDLSQLEHTEDDNEDLRRGVSDRWKFSKIPTSTVKFHACAISGIGKPRTITIHRRVPGIKAKDCPGVYVGREEVVGGTTSDGEFYFYRRCICGRRKRGFYLARVFPAGFRPGKIL